jgi:hypothetical protein
VRGDRLLPAAQLERADLLQLDAAAHETGGAGADEDLARAGLLLEPRGEVDGLARGERRLRVVVGDDLAGLDPDPRLEPQLANPLQRREARAHGALCVVLVRQRHAERGHHRVAGELLDDPTVRDDAMGDLLEELRDATADDLGVRACEELRRGDEIDEQDGCELPFH